MADKRHIWEIPYIRYSTTSNGFAVQITQQHTTGTGGKFFTVKNGKECCRRFGQRRLLILKLDVGLGRFLGRGSRDLNSTARDDVLTPFPFGRTSGDVLGSRLCFRSHASSRLQYSPPVIIAQLEQGHECRFYL